MIPIRRSIGCQVAKSTRGPAAIRRGWNQKLKCLNNNSVVTVVTYNSVHIQI